MSLESHTPIFYSLRKYCPNRVTPNIFPIERVLRYISSKKALAACSLVCKSWREKSQEALFSKSVILTSAFPLVDCLFTTPSPRNGGCMIQFVPPLKILTLRNTRLSLPDIENLLRWLPSLNHLTIVDPVLIQDVKAFDHTRRAVVLFSLTTLTVTCRADSWPVATFALFLSKLLSMLQSLESWKAYLEGEPVPPAQVQVSNSTSPFLNIRKMTFSTQATVLRHIPQTVPGTFYLPELHEHFRSPPEEKTVRHWKRLWFNQYYLHIQSVRSWGA